MTILDDWEIGKHLMIDQDMLVSLDKQTGLQPIRVGESWGGGGKLCIEGNFSWGGRDLWDGTDISLNGRGHIGRDKFLAAAVVKEPPGRILGVPTHLFVQCVQ